MGRNKRGARVLGPYREARGGGIRFRVVQVDASGERTPHYAATEAQAASIYKACCNDLGLSSDPANTATLTIRTAADRFIASKTKAGAWADKTTGDNSHTLKCLTEATGNITLTRLSPRHLRGFIEAMAPLALATQRSRFALVSEFCSWCARRGYLSSNPVDKMEPTDMPWRGKRASKQVGRGKPQLRNMQEVQQYLAAALALRRADDRIGATLPLLCGLRSGELRHLRVCDIDFAGGRIWIRSDSEAVGEVADGWDVKTASSRRTVELPPVLLDDLRGLCADRSPDDYLLVSNRNGRAWSIQWLGKLVHDVCEAAGVRMVPPHGLRDTHATLLRELARKTAAEIGELLGHADRGKTAEQHYIGSPEHRPALKVVHGNG